MKIELDIPSIENFDDLVSFITSVNSAPAVLDALTSNNATTDQLISELRVLTESLNRSYFERAYK